MHQISIDELLKQENTDWVNRYGDIIIDNIASSCSCELMNIVKKVPPLRDKAIKKGLRHFDRKHFLFEVMKECPDLRYEMWIKLQKLINEDTVSNICPYIIIYIPCDSIKKEALDILLKYNPKSEVLADVLRSAKTYFDLHPYYCLLIAHQIVNQNHEKDDLIAIIQSSVNYVYKNIASVELGEILAKES